MRLPAAAAADWYPQRSVRGADPQIPNLIRREVERLDRSTQSNGVGLSELTVLETDLRDALGVTLRRIRNHCEREDHHTTPFSG